MSTLVLRNARMLAGIDLVVKGDTPEEKARALLASLIDHGMAEHVEDEPPAPVTVPAAVWHGLEAVKDSGTTNMLDRPAIIKIDNRTTLLLGHTRRCTRGDEKINENNRSIRAGNILGTHNGTIYNANTLFRRFELHRFAEVDSELLFRLAALGETAGST